MFASILSAASSILLLWINQTSEVATDFNDLGKLLLGGFAVACAIAVIFALISVRIRGKRPPAEMISIRSTKDK